MQKVIVYARKSTEQEDRQMLSIDAQLRELNAYAAKAQLHIVASLREARTARKPVRLSSMQLWIRIKALLRMFV